MSLENLPVDSLPYGGFTCVWYFPNYSIHCSLWLLENELCLHISLPFAYLPSLPPL